MLPIILQKYPIIFKIPDVLSLVTVASVYIAKLSNICYTARIS